MIPFVDKERHLGFVLPLALRFQQLTCVHYKSILTPDLTSLGFGLLSVLSVFIDNIFIVLCTNWAFLLESNIADFDMTQDSKGFS